MAETHRTNRPEGLKLLLAGGLIIFTMGARKESASHQLARAPAIFQPIPGLTTSLGRSFQGLVGPRAVLAGVAETYRKNRLEGLKLSLAVGPFILGSGARKESASHHGKSCFVFRPKN